MNQDFNNQSAPAIPPAPKTNRRPLMRPSCHQTSSGLNAPGGAEPTAESGGLHSGARPLAEVAFLGWQEVPEGTRGAMRDAKTRKPQVALFNLLKPITDRHGVTTSAGSTVTQNSLKKRGFSAYVVSSAAVTSVAPPDHFAVCLKAISDLYEEGDLEQCERVLLIAQSTLHQMRIEARCGEDGVVKH